MPFPCNHPKPAWPVAVAALLTAAAPAWAQEPAPAASDEPARPNDTRPAQAEFAELPESEDGPAQEFDWGADIPEADRERAEALFLEGNQLYMDTLFARAADKYEQALSLWDHPSFHYNLALARIHLDQSIAAYQHLRQAVPYGPAPLGGQERYTHARSYLKLLEGQLAEIEVACEVPGARVTLDGKPLFMGPGRRTVVIPSGGHVLMATKSGRVAHTQEIVLAPGQQAKFSLAPPYPDRVVMVRRWPAWIPWTVTGAGLAIAAGAGILDWRSSAAFDRYDQEIASLCPNTQGCEPGVVSTELLDQRERAEGQQWLARAIYLAGGTALATGAVLLYLNRERPVRRQRTDAPSVSVHPMLAPDATGVRVHLHF